MVFMAYVAVRLHSHVELWHVSAIGDILKSTAHRLLLEGLQFRDQCENFVVAEISENLLVSGRESGS